MELLYSVRRKPLKFEPPHITTALDPEVIRPICTISSCNIIAFSSFTELSDTDGDTWGGYVYVCDMDTPWDSHQVTSTHHPVSCLEWDSEGKQLLVATTVGQVSVFAQKGHVLNEWACVSNDNFPGERIIKGAFFHNGRRVVCGDKKVDAPLPERVVTLRAAPTLKGFGGGPREGVLLVSGSGLALACAGGAAAAEPVPPHRDTLYAADIAYRNGSPLLAVLSRGCARISLVTVTRQDSAVSSISLTLQPLPAIYLNTNTCTSICWTVREDPDSLLLGGAALALWRLAERALPVHKLLAKGPMAGNTTPGGGAKPGSDCFNTLAWQQTSLWSLEDNEGSVCAASCRLPHASHAVLAQPQKLVLLALDNRHCAICSVRLPTAPEGGSPPKKLKFSGRYTGPVAACVDVSWLGGAAACVDSAANLHVYKLRQPWDNIPPPLAVQHAASLLEFAACAPLDYLDILLTLKPATVEPLYDRITENFQRQPQPFQQYYFHTWLKLRVALCRLVSSLHVSASWLNCLQALHCVAAACVTDDHLDDKALLALEAKAECACEAGVGAALRTPLQRAAHIAHTVIAAASVPQHGYSLVTDPSALALLRKLLVVGGRGGEANRLLQRLTTAPAHKPDLLEECAAFAAASPAPRVFDLRPVTRVCAAPARPPHLLQYGTPPSWLRAAPDTPPFARDADVQPRPDMDSVRYVYVGACARVCGRCGARALPPPHADHYDARYLPACRCGGKWTLTSCG